MLSDHPNIFGCMLALSNVLSQEWVPGSAIIADFYQQLGKETFVWLLAQFLNKWLLSQPLQIPPHHHQPFQVQTSHSEHARNVIKSLHGDKLIISSGYEQTHECGFWPCCLMRGHPRGAGGLVSFHPRAIFGIWESWSKMIWPLFPRLLTAPVFGNTALDMEIGFLCFPPASLAVAQMAGAGPLEPTPHLPHPSTSLSPECPSRKLIKLRWASQDR